MAKYRVAGYVKLAKLWERSRDKAVSYHNQYYRDKFQSNVEMDLYGVYIDITGQKNIKKRPEMVHLIHDCLDGKVNCIAVQTRAYLAADNEEFFYLIHLLLNMSPPVHIVTEDDNYKIDTIRNEENQVEALKKMALDFVSMNQDGYNAWKVEVLQADYKKI